MTGFCCLQRAVTTTNILSVLLQIASARGNHNGQLREKHLVSFSYYLAVSKTKVQVLVVNSCSVILFSFNTCNLALHIFARLVVIEVSLSHSPKDLNRALQVSC